MDVAAGDEEAEEVEGPVDGQRQHRCAAQHHSAGLFIYLFIHLIHLLIYLFIHSFIAEALVTVAWESCQYNLS